MRTHPRSVDLVRGSGRFVADLVAGTDLAAVFVRSGEAHALVRALDLAEPRGVPGVVAVLSAADLDLADLPGVSRPGIAGCPEMTWPILARDRVRFGGEAIALIVAESLSAAQNAAELVWPDLEPLDVITSPGDALTDRILLHPSAGTNVSYSIEHASGTCPGDCAIQAELKVSSGRVAPVPIEPLAMIVRPEPGGLEIICAHQTPHRLRNIIARGLAVDPTTIRVVVPDVGGGFGQKGAIYPEYLALARAAQLLGCPIAWMQDRRDNLSAATHGRGVEHTIRIHGDRSGRFSCLDVDIVGDLGAYPYIGNVVTAATAFLAPGPYRFPTCRIRATGVVTNTTPSGPYRGAGRPEATFALERAVDEFAHLSGLDPIDVRHTNLLGPGELPHRSVTGALYDSGDYPRALRRVADHLDVEERRREQRRRRQSGEDPLGIGVACFVERAGGPIEYGEYAAIELSGDGVTILSGACPTGQGTEEAFRVIAARSLGVEMETVRIVTGDTARVPQGGGTYGSRSAQLGGGAVLAAAEAVRTQLIDAAHERFGVDRNDLVCSGGEVRSIDGEHRVPLDVLAKGRVEDGAPIRAETVFSPGAHTFPYGCYGAVVSVAVETGEVTVERLVALDDCGVILDPPRVAGQVVGAIVQGLGQALSESVLIDANGQLMTSTLMDYLIPTAPGVPAIEILHEETPSISNPLGVKGIGESGCIGAPPAVVNAVVDALRPWGISNLDMPLSPQRVWLALQEGEA